MIGLTGLVMPFEDRADPIKTGSAMGEV